MIEYKREVLPLRQEDVFLKDTPFLSGLGTNIQAIFNDQEYLDLVPHMNGDRPSIDRIQEIRREIEKRCEFLGLAVNSVSVIQEQYPKLIKEREAGFHNSFPIKGIKKNAPQKRGLGLVLERLSAALQSFF